MAKKTNIMTPSLKITMANMGNQIKLARLRRNLSMELISERANITRPTLAKIEKGDSSVSIGSYARVLQAIGGLHHDLELIAKDDVMGRTMMELGLKIAKRSKSS